MNTNNSDYFGLSYKFKSLSKRFLSMYDCHLFMINTQSYRVILGDSEGIINCTYEELPSRAMRWVNTVMERSA